MNKNGYLKKTIIITVVLTVFAIFLYFTFSNTERSAILHFDAGKVYVNEKPVLQDVKLKQKDIIKTGDGKATVILYNSVIIMLEPNTVIALEDLTKKNPKVEQIEGKTWNKFIKVAGVEEYTIKSGNSVASVRGTFFGIEENKIMVSEGEVEYAVDEEVFFVTEDEIVEETDQGAIERAAHEEEYSEMQEAMPEAVDEMIYLAELVAEEQDNYDGEENTEYTSESIIEEINAEMHETTEEIDSEEIRNRLNEEIEAAREETIDNSGGEVVPEEISAEETIVSDSAGEERIEEAVPETTPTDSIIDIPAETTDGSSFETLPAE